MSTSQTARLTASSFATRSPALVYFLATFTISWLGAFLLVAPRLLHHQSVPKFAGLMMFPVMLLGPSLSGFFLTWPSMVAPAFTIFSRGSLLQKLHYAVFPYC